MSGNGCFQRMQSEGISTDAITYTCILKACGSIRKIHDSIVNQGLLKQNVVVGNALLDMYAKFGVFAQKVLQELRVWNTISWNILIVGYALHR